MSLRNTVLGLLLLPASMYVTGPPCFAQDEAKERFAYVGPLTTFMPEGKVPGVVTSGLGFTITLTNGGKTISGGPYELKIPGVDKAVKLTLSDLMYTNSHVVAKAKLENGAGEPIEGVRLDITGATETYKAKDDQGKDVLKTRPQQAAISSPLSFGDIADGADNGELTLDVSTVTFAPETTEVAVHGVVSGLLYVKTLDLDETAPNGEIDVDSKGRVYVSSTVGNQVSRIDGDGKNRTVAAKLPDQAKGMAVNPLTGEIAATCGNNPKIFIFTAGGDDKTTIGEAQGVDNYPCWMRYDSKGTLWGTVTSGPWHFGPDGKPVAKFLKAGDYELGTDNPFDVAPDGSVYAVADKTLYRVMPDGKSAKRVAVGPGFKLGQLTNPAGVRVDRQGNVYVAEGEGDNGTAAARISVFDSRGSFVRCFGRGAKAPAPGFPDETLAAEVLAPSDIAFGPDGRVYINCNRKNDSNCHVLVFQPF